MLERSTTLDAGIVDRQSSIVDIVDPPALLEDSTGPFITEFSTSLPKALLNFSLFLTHCFFVSNTFTKKILRT
jgi:hypothetical protein